MSTFRSNRKQIRFTKTGSSTWNGGGIYPTAEIVSPFVTDTRFTTANVSGALGKLRKGEFVATGLSGTRFYMPSYRHMTFYMRRADGWVEQASCPSAEAADLFVGNAYDPSLDSVAYGRAAVALAKAYRKEVTTFQGATFTGQVAQTLRMLASPARALRKEVDRTLSEIRKVYKRTRNSELARGRAVANTWLEASFGWRPLVQDVQDAARLVGRFAAGELRTHDYVRIVGTGSAESILTSFENRGTGLSGFSGMDTWGLDNEVTVTDHQQQSCRYIGFIQCDSQGRPAPAAALAGFSAFEAAPTAWELIPWSFLVDYFSNVGDIIDAWSMRWVDLSHHILTVRKERIRTVTPFKSQTVSGLSGGIPFIASVSGGGVKARTVTVARTVPASLVLHLPPAAFKIPGTGTQWTNINALLLARAHPPR